MRVPLPWLREYCDPDLDVGGIEERLTMTGTKVEAIHRVGVAAAENFVVGHVLSAEQHPDADRLKVCNVDLGRRRAGDDRLRRAERRRRADGRGRRGPARCCRTARSSRGPSSAGSSPKG